MSELNKYKNYIDKYYIDTKYDLYSAFIERSIKLCKENGYISMITMHSFMFISSFRNFRKNIFFKNNINVLAHLGPYAFEDITGEIVNTVLFTLKRNNNNKFHKGIYIDLTKESNKKENIKSLKNFDKFIIPKDKFSYIEGMPVIYKLGNLLDIFNKYESLKNQIISSQGLNPKNVEKYIRYHWEIRNKDTWISFSKGTENESWCCSNSEVIDWSNKSQKEYKKNNCLAGADLYFKDGITFSRSGNNFHPRIIKNNQIFGDSSPIIIPNAKLVFFLGLLNSKLYIYFMNIFNPTIHFQTGDVKKLPYFPPDIETERHVSELAQQCVNIKKDALQFVINDREFKQTAIQWGYKKNME